VLYLSHYLKRHRQQYYDRLQAIRDQGDWEGWLSFFLDGVTEVSVQATETTRRILRLREQLRDGIIQHLGRAAGNGLKVLEHMFRQPIVSVNEVMELTGITYPAANQLVHRLVKQGVLTEMTGQARNRRFFIDKYVALFIDDTTETPAKVFE